MNHNLRANKTNFDMKGLALGLALKQRRNATWKSPVVMAKVKVFINEMIANYRGPS